MGKEVVFNVKTKEIKKRDIKYVPGIVKEIEVNLEDLKKLIEHAKEKRWI